MRSYRPIIRPQRLWLCQTRKEKVGFVANALMNGDVITESSISPCGISPDSMLAALRRKGLRVKRFKDIRKGSKTEKEWYWKLVELNESPES
jgi:hypothetical protein